MFRFLRCCFCSQVTYEREYDLAETALREGLTITRKLGAGHANNFLFFLGDIELQKGDRPRAKKIYEESADVLRGIGNKSFLAYPLRRLGYLALEQIDIPNARKYFQESLTLNQEVGDKTGVAACLVGTAALAKHLDKPILAARLYGAVESWLESLSINLLYLDQAELGRIRSQLLTSLDEATFTVAFTQGWELSEDQAIKLVEEITRR